MTSYQTLVIPTEAERSEPQSSVIPTEAERSERSGGTCFYLQSHARFRFPMMHIGEGN
jgi:hypothetical protein